MSKDVFAQSVVAEVRDAYNAIADHFADTRSRQWEEVRFLIEHAVRPGEKLLDIGCGGGRVAEICDDCKVEYVGVDLSEQMIERSKKEFPGKEFHVADMQSLPFEDAKFDHSIAVASFHHLPDDATRLRALSEMARVVKPGGTIMLLNWNLLQPRFWPLRWNSVKAWLFGKKQYGWRDVLVPWKNQKREVLAERYYHAFTKREFRQLVNRIPTISLLEQYYELRGLHVPRRRGQNLVTIIRVQ
jgi:ubiquinone/menaquinone biosynthesis C-methylase UbiE